MYHRTVMERTCMVLNEVTKCARRSINKECFEMRVLAFDKAFQLVFKSLRRTLGGVIHDFAFRAD